MEEITIGGTVYIKTKDCRLLKRPQPRDQSYGFLMLQPGTPVTWLGAAPEDKAFHKIQYKGQIAYTLLANLSQKQFAEFVPHLHCVRCQGTGQVSVLWRNSYGFTVCPLCGGSGGEAVKPIDSQAFSSYGTVTKA